MMTIESQKYKTLNELADQGGIVILGGSDDLNIPLCELRQAFAIESKIYNRSVTDLSIHNAIQIYDELVAPLAPDTILLHIGEADLEYFTNNASAFDQKYRSLITHIQSLHKNCRIAIISFQNKKKLAAISELNKHLKYIAESEQCEYGDISNKRVWNPKGTMDAISFVYTTGFVHPLKMKRPIYDLVKILFGFECSISSLTD